MDENSAAPHNDVLIAGGGPAGIMAGLLFARAGLTVTVLEKHDDFLRDFRGDTVHPSTMEILAELGLLGEFLALPHDRVDHLRARISGEMVRIADFGHLPVAAPFIAMMPQWHFLDFLARKAKAYPGFRLLMQCKAVGMTRDARGRVTGLVTDDGERRSARLVIAADGRDSLMRAEAGLPRKELAVPIDIFWLRVPKAGGGGNESFAHFGQGRILVLIDRGDYWQCAFVFSKGAADLLRAEGLEAFKRRLVAIEPALEQGLGEVTDFDEVKLLSVSLDRLTRWWMPGFLAIGDAAHAMSPVGGVGINLAIQDAVAAANILASPMVAGADPDSLLAEVQKRRLGPTRIVQGLQRFAHQNFIAPLIEQSGDAAASDRGGPPLAARLIDHSALLRRVPARIVGLGFRREHVRSPNMFG